MGETRKSTSAEAILEATRRVIAERGSGKLTLSAIAATAGVSRPTLYRWFPTKTALLDALTIYEEERFVLRLQAVIEVQPTPARRLDAALRCLVTYLDGLMGPDPIGADPGFAIQSLGSSLAPQTASFVRLLGDGFDAVPAVRLGHLTREQAAELFLRLAYSHYLVPHPKPEVLLATMRSFAGLAQRSITRSRGRHSALRRSGSVVERRREDPHGPRLDEATAVVTGGSSGMGRAAAECIADDGARVAVLARRRSCSTRRSRRCASAAAPTRWASRWTSAMRARSRRPSPSSARAGAR